MRTTCICANIEFIFQVSVLKIKFFAPQSSDNKKGSETKKKRLLPRKSGPVENGKSKKRREEDDEILSDDPDVEGVPGAGSDEGYPPSPEDNETAEEKRLRLAKKYLEEIQREGKI